MDGSFINKFPHLRGQSLIELLIAIGVAGLFITGVTSTIEFALKSSVVGRASQTASYLGQELLDAVSVIANANWLLVGGVVGSAYVVPPTTVSLGTELVPANGINYTRFFTVEHISRDANNNVLEIYDVDFDDPSTKRIVVTLSWPGGGLLTFTKLITRHQNAAFVQTDWFGGDSQNGIILDSTKFATQSGIDVSQSGSLKLSGF